MKKIILLAIFLTGFTAYAQMYQIPAKSPRQSISQEFSYDTVELEYSRPAVKDRTIFGDLVPTDKVWRLGADEATKITFNQHVMIAGSLLKKGTYALFAIPEPSQWTMIFNTVADQWGAYQYDETKDALRINIPTHQITSKTESLTMQFSDLEENAMNLEIYWDNTMVSIPIEVADQEKSNQIIDKLKEIKTLQK